MFLMSEVPLYHHTVSAPVCRLSPRLPYVSSVLDSSQWQAVLVSNKALTVLDSELTYCSVLDSKPYVLDSESGTEH